MNQIIFDSCSCYHSATSTSFIDFDARMLKMLIELPPWEFRTALTVAVNLKLIVIEFFSLTDGGKPLMLKLLQIRDA